MDTEYCNQNSCSSENRVTTNRRWIVMRFAVAAIFLVAAGLKAHQLATTPYLGEGLLHARWFNIFVVEFELFFGIWLIFGMLPKLTWFGTVGCFSIFASVSLYKAVSGEGSCGCFGAAEISPWVTTLFDVSLVGMLMLFRPTSVFFQYLPRSQFVLCIGIYFLTCTITYTMIAQITFERFERVGQVLESNTVQLTPVSWIGKEFPLRNYVVDGQEIIHGNWIIMFSRPGCSDCEKVKVKLLENGDRKEDITVAFLDITAQAIMGNSATTVRNFRLVPKINWIVETPVIIELNKGIVQNVQTREQLLPQENKKHLMFGTAR